MRLALAALALLGGAASAQEACSPNRFFLQTPSGAAAFTVAIADDPASRAQGLMGVRAMDSDAGMLFIFPDAAPRAFWMRNTPLSLDMLFFAEDGRLCGLVERAPPFTDTPRHSGCDAKAVLELVGGAAARLGVKVGAVARHGVFGEGAAWGC